MFVADPRLTHIAAAPEQVAAVFGSLNKPHIAVPGKAAQEVQAYVVGAATAPGSFTLFVYLYLTQSGEAVIYVDSDQPRVDSSGYASAESDAVAFVESMGFMLETLNVRSLAPPQRAALLKSLPCFSRDPRAMASARPEAKAPDRAETPQVKLARLFGAF